MHQLFDLGFILLLLGVATAREISMEIRSLLEFKKGIQSDPSGRISDTWDSSSIQSNGCPLDWHGVTCSDDGSVSAITLAELALEGNLKFSTLSGLKSLTNLTLTRNSLTGRLVPAIGYITSLQHLDLSGNQFYGPVPVRITQLWGLKYLNLSSNNFTGGFPVGMQNLQLLKVLDLHGNQLYGNLGVLLSELRSPEYVDLSSNSFYGQLFMDANNLSSLAAAVKHVNLSCNKLNGGFLSSDSISMFRNLESLDLTHNQMTGTLPPILMPSLRILRLGDNLFYGSLPVDLFYSSSVVAELDLSVNGFSGSVPEINSTTLKALNLSSNSLSGSLPSKIGNCKVLDLSNNSLSGEVATVTTWDNTLQHIDLSSNLLSGEFPDLPLKFENLISISMRNNTLKGSLPTTLMDNPRLAIIDLSLNKFEGSVPRSFFTSLALISLNFSGNHLNGTIQLGDTHSIESLVLPSSPRLESLDMSNNLLTGNLPSEVGNLERLRLLNLRVNHLSGPLPEQLDRLSFLEDLDLSCNSFVGKLPTKLSPNIRAFNVSYNNLSGRIPETMRRFPSSSFQPGNKFLVIEPALPTKSSNKHIYRIARHHHSVMTGLKFVIIIGCVGGVVLITFILLAFVKTQQQEYQGRSGLCGQHGRLDGKLTRFTCRSLCNFNQPNDQPSASLHFSNDQLLSSQSRSVCRQKDHAISSDFGVKSSPALTRDWKFSSSSHISSPVHVDSGVVDQPVLLSVCSPDRLVGDLVFLEKSSVFTLEELSGAEAEVLGRSNRGTLYKATLPNGHTLKVKWLQSGLVKHKKIFTKEVKRIGTARHPNLVSPRAYYWGRRDQERLLISDYFGGESLFHLYDASPGRRPLLHLTQRLGIAVNVARGLYYLHHSRNLPHGNLKPTNILLVGCTPDVKLTDYGLHLLITSTGISEQMINLAALGYGAPELTNSRKMVPSYKADVYSFGVILIELLTRRSAGEIISGQSGAVDLTDWVKLCVNEGHGSDCFDRDLAGSEVDPVVMEELLAVSLRCIGPEDARPDIKTVLEDLCSLSA